MGEDLERKGSLSYRRRNSKGVYPMQDPQMSVPYVAHEKRRISILVPLIVVVNVVMFVITMYINNCPKNTANNKCIAQSFLRRFSFQPFSENPLLGPSSRALEKLGALDVNKVIHQGQGWRLFTCIWLHAGVFHILANMLSLLVIGIRLEQEFGFIKVGLIYLLSGVGGSLLSALFLQDRISVGASGALFGLLGAMLSELITNWSIYSNKCAALLTLVLVVAMNLAVGILPHVDNFAHIGGFLVGFLSGFVFLLRPQFGWVNKAHLPPGYATESPKSKHKVYQYLFLLVALAILIACFITAAVMVFKGVDGNAKCTWCHYLSCVPTSKWSCNDSGTASCNTTQTGDLLQVTCISNNKTSSTSANQSTTVLQDFCAQLCS